ncbi:MAG: tetratricopeptide repeat protein [Bacteroidales bacterium]|nr:tetratricopeptide repeat protein [Bacteroidales bacterium]
MITAFLNLGFIYEKKGNFLSANNYYLEGLKIGEKRRQSVKILRGLANNNFLQEKNKEAEIFYDRAINSSIELNGPEHPETALTYFKYGEFCSITGNNAKAIAFMTKGLGIYIKAYGEKSRNVGYAYLFIANFHERNKQYRQALTYFQKALISGFSNFSNPDFLMNPEPEKNNLNYIQLNMLSGKASALFSYSNPSPPGSNISMPVLKLMICR